MPHYLDSQLQSRPSSSLLSSPPPHRVDRSDLLISSSSSSPSLIKRQMKSIAASSTSSTPPQMMNHRLEVRAALQRQQEMVRRIKEVQSLSPSPYIQSAFSPSISSTKPRKQKAEFHFRSRSISTQPPKAELQDLSLTTAAAANVALFRDNQNKKKSNGGRLIRSSSTPEPASSLGKLVHQDEVGVGDDDDRKLNNPLETATKTAEAAAIFRSSSPVALRIFTESNQVRMFNSELTHSKMALENQIRVEPSAVVKHDDIRVTRMTKKQTKRANFIRGVMGEKKLNANAAVKSSGGSRPGSSGGSGGLLASRAGILVNSSTVHSSNHNNDGGSVNRLRKTVRLHSDAKTTMHDHADYDDEEAALDEWKFSPTRVLTPNPDRVPDASAISPQHHRFVSTPQGAKCRVVRHEQERAPTDLTRQTCKILSQFKSLQNAVKKVDGKKSIDLSVLEAQMNRSYLQQPQQQQDLNSNNNLDATSSPTNSTNKRSRRDDEQQKEQNSAVMAIAEISKRRGGLVRRT